MLGRALSLVILLAASAHAVDRALPPGLPPGCLPVVRSATSATTIYTVATGRRLHITNAWVTVGQPNTTPATGVVQVTVSGIATDANSRVLAQVAVGDNAAQSNSVAVNTLDVPVPAAATVAVAQTGAAGATFAGGFNGYDCPTASKPNEV